MPSPCKRPRPAASDMVGSGGSHASGVVVPGSGGSNASGVVVPGSGVSNASGVVLLGNASSAAAMPRACRESTPIMATDRIFAGGVGAER